MTRTSAPTLATAPTPTRRRGWLGLFATLACAWGSAAAQPVPTAALERLAAQTAANGSTRVIVGLNVATSSEARLGRVAALSQRASIRAAQNAAVSQLLSGSGGRAHALFDTVPHFAAEVDANGLARLRASRLIASIQEDVAVSPSLLESNALMHTATAWNSGRTGSGWAVAVLDTGIDKTHPFLAGKVVSEACYSSTTSQSSSVCPGGVASSVAAGSGVNCNTSISGCTHGTHVGGIVAGTGAADGSHGVARGAELIAVQVFSHFPAQGAVMSYTSDQIKGLERVYALRDTYQIASVNMSLGGGQYSSLCDSSNLALKAAIDNLRAVGIATVIASGNNGYRSSISAPACISSAISVGSHCDAGPDGSACATGVGGVASYSNIASFVSLLGPGSYITSSVPGGGYAAWNGTSMAAPQVAGAWALLKQAQPGISVDDGLSLMRANGVAVNDTRSGGVVSGMTRIDLAFLAGEAYTLTVAKAGSGSGAVVSAPNGINCGSDCSEPYSQGTTVTLNPSASTGSTFAGWSGACSGSGACTVTMSEARSVTATFNAIPYTLSVTKAGTGSGTVTSTPAGINCGATCSAAMNGGTAVTLTATPAEGSRFVSWAGACTGSGSCTLAMTAARSVTATFSILSYPVTVTKAGTGTGTVTSAPSGISCGSSCTVTKVYGSTLTLSATPAAGMAFAGWGGACSGTGSCTVSVTAAQNLSATFNRSHYTLSVSKSGSGSLSSSPAGIDCGTVCSVPVAVNASVTLSAAPLAGWRLGAWGGACSGTGECTVTMSEARSVSASFVRITHALTVTPGGTGLGSIVSSVSGINCGSACSAAYNAGTVLGLTAKAGTGSVFAGWGGACSGTGSCSVTMSEPRAVTATFTRTHHTLTVAKVATGTVVSSPAAINCGSACVAQMALDSVVTLSATPPAETTFAGWGGACSGTGSCSVTMSEARNVSATFTRSHYTLTVKRTGTGSGAVASSPAAIDCGASCISSIAVGTSVTLSATPAAGSRFAGWTGACTGSAGCTVAMSAARSVTAAFTVLSYPVAVTRDGSGVGTVTSSPTGLSCGSACTVNRNHGSTLTLTAVPASGSVFAGWGGACSGTGTCSLGITEARAVSATFTRTHQTLSTSKSGTGTGTVTSSPAAIICGSTCSALAAIDTEVTLTATPAADMAFTGWSGACSGTDPSCTVAMSQARSAVAGFARTHHVLTYKRAGTGAGTVGSSPAAVDCDTSCATSVPVGTQITLTPVAADGSRFVSWSGACIGTGNCTVTMSAARSVTATFTRYTYTLAVAKNGTGAGTVTSAPTGIACGSACSRTLNSLTELTLTAVPASGSVFTGWSGACSGSGPCTVTMTAAQSVAATFTRP